MHHLLDEPVGTKGVASLREPLLPVALAGLILSILFFTVLLVL